MLGGRVDAVAERREDAGHRRRRHEVALAAGDPARQQRPGRVDVGHHVDVPLQGPHVVGRVGAAAVGDAGVGEPQVDRPVGVLDLVARGRSSPPRRRRRAPWRRRARRRSMASARTSVATTVSAPAATSARTSAPPMPPAAPVTTAILPLGSMAGTLRRVRWIRETPCCPAPVVTGETVHEVARSRPADVCGGGSWFGRLFRAPTPADATEGCTPASGPMPAARSCAPRAERAPEPEPAAIRRLQPELRPAASRSTSRRRLRRRERQRTLVRAGSGHGDRLRRLRR